MPNGPVEEERPQEGEEEERGGMRRWVPWAIGGTVVTGLLAAWLGGCFKSKEPGWEEVLSDAIIPEYNLATTPRERDQLLYKIETRGRDEKGNPLKNSYEIRDPDMKAVQRAFNDIDIGDEVRVRGPRISNVDVRDRYISGNIDTVEVQYFQNTRGIEVSGQINVYMTDLNGKQLTLTYEGIPLTIRQAYEKLLEMSKSTRTARLPRHSDDLATALFQR